MSIRSMLIILILIKTKRLMGEFVSDFLSIFVHYVDEIWLTLAVGFLLSGIMYLYLPADSVEKYLGKKGVKPILVSSFIGTILPVCCIGTLPIAVTLNRKGASLGAVLAFLITTPATSISALIVCLKLMGIQFTVLIFIAVVLMGLVVGLICNSMSTTFTSHSETDWKDDSCCEKPGDVPVDTFFGKIKKVLHYAFIELPRNMGLEILVGIALASLITVVQPIQTFIQEHLLGAIGYIFILFFGLITYVCSTASVPMAHAFLNSGMSSGQSLCYLLVGPITSYSAIMIVRKDFGNKVLGLYLGIICVFSVSIGVVIDIIGL